MKIAVFLLFVTFIEYLEGFSTMSRKYIQLYDGIKIAYQEWGSQHMEKVIAVHGWLDNSNSFRFLGPFLGDRGFHVVAVDLIGHGFSDHLGQGATYTVHKSAAVTREFIDCLGWKNNHFIGHSMVLSRLFSLYLFLSFLLIRVRALE
jgi:pimeloyl-ACP methyl ester carboxylesterase